MEDLLLEIANVNNLQKKLDNLGIIDIREDLCNTISVQIYGINNFIAIKDMLGIKTTTDIDLIDRHKKTFRHKNIQFYVILNKEVI